MKHLFIAALISGILAPFALVAQPVLPPTIKHDPREQLQQQDNAQRMSPVAFIAQAVSGNMLEIQSSKLAADRSRQDSVKQFAEKMVKDHSEAAERMTEAAMGQTIPGEMSSLHAQSLNQLRQADEQQFDAQYLQMQVQAHEDAVLLYEQYAATGEQESLKQYAEQMLPILREHLQSVKQITAEAVPG